MKEVVRRTPLPVVVIVAALTLVLAGLGFGAATRVSAAPGAEEPLWTTLPPGPAGLPQDAPLDMSSFARLAKTLKPTVVNVTVKKKVRATRLGPGFFGPFGAPEGFGQGTGSGFVIRKDGFILTNNHVIEGADQITVLFPDGTSYEARVVGADEATDMALLKIEPKAELAVAPLGDSDRLEVGEWVLAIGNPFGLSHTVTAGIVSATGRKDIAPEGRHMIANFIQTDASINPGNSGGPLFNIRGEVIGMATAINPAGQGIGFAIPVNMIKTLLPQLGTGHVERSWLGVMIRPVTDAHVAALGLPSAKGAIVVRVVPGGPADEGGLEAGDVIVGFDGKPIDASTDLQWLASTAGDGKQAELDVFRRGERQKLRVTLGSMPGQAVASARSDGEGPDRGNRGSSGPSMIAGVGVQVTANTPALRKRLSLATQDGVVVTDVDAGSSADAAGLRAGDVLLVVGTTKVSSVAEFQQAIQQVRPGQLVSLVVLRDGETLFLDFTRSQP